MTDSTIVILVTTVVSETLKLIKNNHKATTNNLLDITRLIIKTIATKSIAPLHEHITDKLSVELFHQNIVLIIKLFYMR